VKIRPATHGGQKPGPATIENHGHDDGQSDGKRVRAWHGRLALHCF
jgi:hypothetical protein